MKKGCIAVCLLLCLLLTAGSALADEYTVGIGDILSVRVWGEEALGADVLVRPDGKISIPGVGDVHAAGLTPTQLQKSIAGKLSNLVHEPMITVMVHTSSNNTVIVHGSGIKSAVMLLEGRTTLLQLLSRLSPESSADLDNAYVARKDQTLVKGLRELFEKGDAKKDVELRPGDRIFIPLRQNRFVYVNGAVMKPATVPHYEGMMLLEAIHLAGGFTKFADRNDMIIVRQAEKGVQNIPIRGADLIDKGDMSQNVPLYGGDFILVKKGWF